MSLFAENKRFFAVSKVAVYSLSEMKILSVSYMSCSESLLKTKKKRSKQNLFWGSDFMSTQNCRTRETTKRTVRRNSHSVTHVGERVKRQKSYS